jgi:hypothetical protein
MMEDYYKGPICAECVGIALRRHERIIQEKVTKAREKDEE